MNNESGGTDVGMLGRYVSGGAHGASGAFPLRRGDVLLALAGTAAVLVEALIGAPADVSPVAYLLVVLAGGPLAFRSVAPLGTLLAVAVGSILCAAVLEANWSVTAITGTALYTVAVQGDRLRSLVVGLLTAIAVAAAVLAIGNKVEAGSLVTRVVLVVSCAVAGELVRSRRDLAAARKERAESDAREREEQLHQRAVAERMEIARELHDTLAHSLVAINVRASVAVDLQQSEDATAALKDIKGVSASALRDLRATLSVLRDPNDQAPTAPAQSLDALAVLVEGACQAGVQAILDVDVQADAIPGATLAATLRIVQEALTNVIRHANAQHARVSVHAAGDGLRIEVTDDGATEASPAAYGLGLQGMTERAAALGGQLQAGPCDGGGWAVRARLPIAGGEIT